MRYSEVVTLLTSVRARGSFFTVGCDYIVDDVSMLIYDLQTLLQDRDHGITEGLVMSTTAMMIGLKRAMGRDLDLLMEFVSPVITNHMRNIFSTTLRNAYYESLSDDDVRFVLTLTRVMGKYGVSLDSDESFRFTYTDDYRNPKAIKETVYNFTILKDVPMSN